jgi:hypothetical protein
VAQSVSNRCHSPVTAVPEPGLFDSLDRFRTGRLEGQVRGVSDEVDWLRRRVALLETERDGDQRGAA